MSSIRIDDIVTVAGEAGTWKVGSIGVETDTDIVLHLFHTDRGVKQRNGFCPAQLAAVFAKADITLEVDNQAELDRWQNREFA